MSHEEVLNQLEDTFLFLALASNKQQLELFVNKHLPVLFDHISSQNEAIRSKVVEIFTELHKRLKRNEDVLLPADQLLERYVNPEGNSFAKNFGLVFLKIGFPRLDANQQLLLLPKLVCAVKNQPLAQQIKLFSMFIHGFSEIGQWSKEKTKSSATFDYSEDYKNFESFFDFLAQILQYPYSAAAAGLSHPRISIASILGGHANEEPMDVDRNSDEDSNYGNASFSVPGICQSVYAHLNTDSFTKEFKTNSKLLENVKLGIVRFLSLLNKDFLKKSIWLLVVASADSYFTVVEAAERYLTVAEDKEDKDSLEKLALTFLGTEKLKNIPPDERKSPVGLKFKLKILTFMQNNLKAQNLFPYNIQIFFESLFGAEKNMKLLQLAVNFGRSIVSFLTDKTAAVFGPLLLNAVEKLVDEYEDPKLLCSAYIMMGDLGKICHSTVAKNVAKVQQLFEEIPREREEVASSIQDCLTAWSDVFMEYSEPAVKKILEALILKYIEHESSKCRLTALKYLEKCCSVDNIESRFALFVACASTDEIVRKEARRILRVSDDTPLTVSNAAYANFDEAVNYCVHKINAKQNITSEKPLAYSMISMKEMVCYLSKSLEQELKKRNFASLKLYIDSAVVQRGTLENCAIFDYFKLLIQLVDAYSVTEPIFLKSLSGLVVPCDTYFLRYFTDKISFYETLIGTISKPDVCHIVCDFYAFVLVRTLENEENFIEKFKSLFSLANQIELALGRSLALAYVSYYSNEHIVNKFVSEFLNVQQFYWHRLKEDEKSVNNLYVVCSSLFVMLKRHHLLIKDETIVLATIDYLLQIIQSRKETIKIRLKEQAVRLLSCVCLDPKKPIYFEKVVDGFIKTGEVPFDIELQIIIGEALACCCRGFNETEGCLSIDEPLFLERLCFVLDKLLNVVAKTDNRHLKQALCNWLYVLLENFVTLPVVNNRLVQIQAVLIDCLTCENEYTQDTACRAMAFVFQQAKEDQKESLIISLLKDLNATNAKDALLPYQELCRLSTSIGNRGTIYIFMQMAVQHRKDGQKDLSLSSESWKTLENYFEKIVPFLYRATYDPLPKVQIVMKIIWSTLTSSRSTNLVELYAPFVLKYLISNLEDKSSRVRESSCLALADLLANNYTAMTAENLADLWSALFINCDDIKESGRMAAAKALVVLQKVTIKFCCPEPGVVKTKNLDLILPVLLSGLNSNVKEVHMLSLLTLTMLTKEAGIKLKPHLPILMTALLESLSSTESQLFNYFAVRANEHQVEQIDDARVAASKSSSMMEAVEYCVRYVDEDVLRELVPKLSSTLQTSIGIATKSGCFRVINLLCVQCSVEIKPYSDKLLKSVIYHGLMDHNSTVRKHASTTIGRLVKFCSETVLKNLFEKAKTWYLDVDSSKSRKMCAYFLRAIANENNELLKAYSSILVPVIFMAVNGGGVESEVAASSSIDSVDSLNAIWQEVWSEMTFGTDVVVKSYAGSITTFCIQTFTSSSNWLVKSQALQSLFALISKYCPLLGDDNLKLVVETLLPCLSGPVWKGKEKILNIFTAIFEQCESLPRLPNAFSSYTEVQLFEIFLKECKKTDLHYRTVALLCIGCFCKSFAYAPGFQTLFEMLAPYLNKEKSLVDSDDDDAKHNPSKIDSLNEFYSAAYKCLSKASLVFVSTESSDSLQKFSSLCLKQLNNVGWKLQLTVLAVLNQLLHDHPDYFDVKALTLAVIITYENAAQNSLKDACIELLNVTCTLLTSCQETIDAGRLKVILDDEYCQKFYPDFLKCVMLLSANT